MLLLFPCICDVFICVLPPHQNGKPHKGRHLQLWSLLCPWLPTESLAVKDQSVDTRCTHDPAPRDHGTQAAHKKFFKLKKGKKYQCTNRNRGPSTTCNVVTPGGAEPPRGTD